MIKGANRRVVVMKDTGSDIFDEAYFIIKKDACKGSRAPIEEAKRIIREMDEGEKGKKTVDSLFLSLLLFTAGGVLGFLLSDELGCLQKIFNFFR